MLFNYFLAGIFTRSVVQIFAKKVAGENSVQIGPNFPAKSLVSIKYILHQFLLIPFHKLIEKYLIN